MQSFVFHSFRLNTNRPQIYSDILNSEILPEVLQLILIIGNFLNSVRGVFYYYYFFYYYYYFYYSYYYYYYYYYFKLIFCPSYASLTLSLTDISFMFYVVGRVRWECCGF